MRKIPVYLCNKKKCENGSCELCHYTTDINYAERDEKGEPIVSYYTEWKRLKWEAEK